MLALRAFVSGRTGSGAHDFKCSAPGRVDENDLGNEGYEFQIEDFRLQIEYPGFNRQSEIYNLKSAIATQDAAFSFSVSYNSHQ